MYEPFNHIFGAGGGEICVFFPARWSGHRTTEIVENFQCRVPERQSCSRVIGTGKFVWSKQQHSNSKLTLGSSGPYIDFQNMPIVQQGIYL